MRRQTSTPQFTTFQSRALWACATRFGLRVSSRRWMRLSCIVSNSQFNNMQNLIVKQIWKLTKNSQLQNLIIIIISNQKFFTIKLAMIQQQKTMIQAQNRQLSIVFVTDIHLSNQNLDKLEKWSEQKQKKFDYCLCGGDISNCDQNNKTHNEVQMEKCTDQVMIRLKSIFGCKVYYIPGNHDPLSYFDQQNKISSDIINIHNKSIQLDDKLLLVGYGGSVPGYLDKQLTTQVWKGYPYSSNQQLQEQLKKDSILQKYKNSKQQLLILTHVGPFKSSTSVAKTKESIYAGATSFDSLVQHDNLILYLHGHTHDGSKYERINKKPIINPGPLCYGQFCYFSLENTEQKWKIKETNFIQL